MRNAAVLALLATAGTAAVASETINYSYDARGRLVKVERSGGPSNGIPTSYSYDKANNRTNRTIGSSSGGGGGPGPGPGSGTIATNPDTLSIQAECGGGIGTPWGGGPASVAMVNVLSNDTAQSPPLSLVAVSMSSLGSASTFGDSVSYSAGSSPGQEVLTYTIQDANGASATGSLTVTVTPGSC